MEFAASPALVDGGTGLLDRRYRSHQRLRCCRSASRRCPSGCPCRHLRRCWPGRSARCCDRWMNTLFTRQLVDVLVDQSRAVVDRFLVASAYQVGAAFNADRVAARGAVDLGVSLVAGVLVLELVRGHGRGCQQEVEGHVVVDVVVFRVNGRRVVVVGAVRASRCLRWCYRRDPVVVFL